MSERLNNLPGITHLNYGLCVTSTLHIPIFYYTTLSLKLQTFDLNVFYSLRE